jgi:hypothetical protein
MVLYKEDEVGECVARMGEMRNTYRILIAKPELKRPLRRSRRRRGDNIKVDLKEVVHEDVD